MMVIKSELYWTVPVLWPTRTVSFWLRAGWLSCENGNKSEVFEGPSPFPVLLQSSLTPDLRAIHQRGSTKTALKAIPVGSRPDVISFGQDPSHSSWVQLR
eukprot:scaffold175_cov153-Cylindrotheca_fusiformis.AAC.5